MPKWHPLVGPFILTIEWIAWSIARNDYSFIFIELLKINAHFLLCIQPIFSNKCCNGLLNRMETVHFHCLENNYPFRSIKKNEQRNQQKMKQKEGFKSMSLCKKDNNHWRLCTIKWKVFEGKENVIIHIKAIEWLRRKKKVSLIAHHQAGVVEASTG